MKTVVLAYHSMGCAGIQSLVRHGYDIQAIFTHQDDPGENTWFDSVANLAAELGIPVYAPEDINHPVWVDRIRSLNPEILFSFYYRKLVKQDILDIPKAGSYNLHGSLLPKYRGRCPVNWVLVNGEQETGITLHEMTAKPDAGGIVGQRKVGIGYDDTAKTLFDKLLAEVDPLMDSVLPSMLEGRIPLLAQDASLASYYGGRKPADGRIDWSKPAEEIRNLVRAVTHPYPGAFTNLAGRQLLVWKADVVPVQDEDILPGTVLSVNPLVVACGSDALNIVQAQPIDGVCMSGGQVAQDAGISRGIRLGIQSAYQGRRMRKPRVLILGVDGFIGNALTERLLESGSYEVVGMDLNANAVERFLDHPDFHFREGDISIHREWIEYQIKRCDIILPLVAIATPIEYTRNPLKVFELDFEENLRIVRYCAQYKKRLIFPSTSEVYGMCDEEVFDEDHSNLTLGPINKQRWIYSCSKQLLDRVIWAYGKNEGLDFTLFRPFNWIGPRLDSLDSARIGSSRAITQLILNLVEGTPIQLIDGGKQKRCFTDVREGIECLFRIIENPQGRCSGEIINIGNPDNEASVEELAHMLVKRFDAHPLRDHFPAFAGYQVLESKAYYGDGYQDVRHRKPSIRNARRLLSWNPVVDTEDSVFTTLDYFLKEALASIRSREQSGEEATVDFKQLMKAQ